MGLPHGQPGRQHPWMSVVAGEAQHGALPFFGCGSRQRQFEQPSVVGRPQALVERAEGPHAGVDQHLGGHFLRVAVGPGHRHHGTQRHGQQVIGSRQVAAGQLRAAVFHHVAHPHRAALCEQGAIARQVQRHHLACGQRRSKLLTKGTPMAALARQAAQQYPSRHGRPPYHSCSACTPWRTRASWRGNHSR
jgi:hypothetical protein